jgi:hypothetical protein
LGSVKSEHIDSRTCHPPPSTCYFLDFAKRQK